MNKAIFLDRDGVINEIIYEEDGRIMAPSDLAHLKIIDLVKEGILKLKKMGFKIISVTNQPGVSLGYLNLEKLKKINDYLKETLSIDEIYSCVHHPKFDGECNCRKPKTELVDKASKDFNIDINKSYVVGDTLSDIEMGDNAGVKKTFRIGQLRTDILELQHQKQIFPDYTFSNLVEVANKIKEIESL